MIDNELALSRDLTWVGVLDRDLEIFDIIMRTEFGTTYNAYLLQAGGKNVLFETVKAAFFDEYAEKLSRAADIKSVDYLVVSHTEPDHAGSVERLLELNPGLKIISTASAAIFLKNIVNRDFFSIAVKDGQKMTIGDKTLTFIHAPFLHWPDTMYTYIEEEKALVTCDSFGSHYAFGGIVSSKIEGEAAKRDYWKATRYYYDCILGPFKPHILSALEKIKGLELKLIMTGHGPVIDCGIEEMFNTYREWSTPAAPAGKSVIIPYVSAYGYTEALSEAIAKGVSDAGDIDVRRYNLVYEDEARVLAEIAGADGVLFGTPTILSEALEPIWRLTISMFPVTHSGKLASAFGSYGWSGEGVPHIIERLKQLKMNVLDGFKVRFKPDGRQLTEAYDFGYNFGSVLLYGEGKAKKRSARHTLVKCLVCGEIFDSSLEVCPVCGVGKENFIPAEALKTDFVNNTNSRYVILGGGAAAYNAAKAIRERDATGSITIVSDEAFLPYNRPMLTKALLAGIAPEQIAISDKSWYSENNIEIRLNAKASGVNAAGKAVTLPDGELHYDKLIYALGAECFIPPIEGAGLPHVFAVRRKCDADKVAGLISGAKNAVVIGGGVLGLEAAWELKKAGLDVTVLETAPLLMGRQLDEETSGAVKAAVVGKGVAVATGVSVTKIDERFVTASGTEYPADIVIISAGVRANAAILKEAGAEAGRAVIVDEHMKTSLPDIYACGDCAEFSGVNFCLWAEAIEQGRVAGANAAGEAVSFANTGAALTFNGFDTALFAIGDLGSKAGVHHKTVTMRDAGGGNVEKLCFGNNRLVGAALIGSTSKMAEITEAVFEGRLFKDMFE